MASPVVGLSLLSDCQADPMCRMTVPPNFVATLSVWGTVWLSSRVNMRAPFIIVSAVIAIIGENTLHGCGVATNPFLRI